MPRRIALIGYGAIGRHHARNLRTLGTADFLGVHDCDASARDRATTDGYATFATFDHLLGERPDAVVLAVPTGAHHALGKRCLQAGLGLFVEKPIARTSCEGEDLVALANDRRLPLMVGYVERYNPAVIAARDFMAHGGIGRVFSISARRLGLIPARIQDADVILDIGVHDIDLAAFLTGCVPTLTAAAGGRALLQDRVDFATLILDAGGVMVDITVNWLTPVKVREMLVTGENGLCHIDYVTQSARFASARENHAVSSFEGVVEEYSKGAFTDLKVVRREPLRCQLEAFVAALDGAPIPDPALSLASLRIAEQATVAIERGARSGGELGSATA